MKLASTKETIPLEIPAADDRPRVTYRFRVPTPLDHARWRQKLRAEGARFHPPGAMRELLRATLKRLLADDAATLARHLGLLDRFDETEAAFGEAQRAHKDAIEAHEAPEQGGDEATELPALPDAYLKAVEAYQAAMADVGELERLVADADASYRERLADNDVFFEYAGIIGAGMFLVGWEGLKAPFARGPTGVADSVLKAIPNDHWSLIGMQVLGLFGPSEAERKNSPSPSPGRSGAPTSTTSSKPRRTPRSKATA